jgi:hypothetical protein
MISYASVYCYTPEVYGTNVRTTGSGAAACFGRASSIFAPAVGGALNSSFSAGVSVSVCSAFMLCGAVAMFFLPIETRGKALASHAAAAAGTANAAAAAAASIVAVDANDDDDDATAAMLAINGGGGGSSK